MPPSIQGSGQFSKTTFSPQKTYEYEYPEGLDLKPGSKLHSMILDRIMERAFYSAKTMSNRHSDWQQIDHTLTAYIPASDAEQLEKDKDSRSPISIVFPNSYTVLETLLSYFVAAFMQDPIFRYEGQGPEDVIGAILLEKVIQFQCVRNKVGLNLHTLARDAFAYGFGAGTPVWKEEFGKKRVARIERGLFKNKTVYDVLEDQLIFEGNALDNIDPYLYLPDTNVPIHEPQKGEFNGWLEHTNFMALLEAEVYSEGEMFNVKYLKELKDRRSSLFPSDMSGRGTRTGISSDSGKFNTVSNITTPISVVKMFIRLIPNDWGLGDKDVPELWYFEIANEEIIVKAKPSGLDHNKYPTVVAAPDFDGYSIAPVSRIEILYGMQGVLDFLFNTHMANVKKAINDMFIYDPYQVNSEDMNNPAPGKRIRLRRPAWGRGVKDVVAQFPVNDVTRANIADSGWIVQWMERISGADSSMQGVLRQGGPDRLTGAEFQGTRAGSMSRLERIVRVIGIQAMQDVGTFFALHNQQLMSQETFVKISGDWQDVLMNEFKGKVSRGRVGVDPADLNILYDVIVRDGSIPGGNFSQSWVQLFQTIMSSPDLSQQFDIPRIFLHIARNLGAKNAHEFIKQGGIKPQAMDDAQVMQQAQRGNIVPISGVM